MKISMLKDMDKKTVKSTTAQARRKNLLIQGNDISNVENIIFNARYNMH